MTNQEFVDRINKEYQKANNLSGGNGGYNILRGTAHSVSGYMEDIFALYMANRINNNSIQYLVDKLISIRFGEKGRSTTFKPDLAILENSELKEYFDLKTNLGWNRDLEKYLTKKNELIRKIKGRNGWIHFSKENIQEITYSSELKYKMVVFNGWNINPDQLIKNIAFASQLENVEIFILNTWNKGTRELKLDNNAFDNLID